MVKWENGGKEVLWPILVVCSLFGETSETTRSIYITAGAREGVETKLWDIITGGREGKFDSVSKPERRRPLWRPKGRWKNNVK
jgi:hypothetical protein